MLDTAKKFREICKHMYTNAGNLYTKEERETVELLYIHKRELIRYKYYLDIALNGCESLNELVQYCLNKIFEINTKIKTLEKEITEIHERKCKNEKTKSL